jgi:hypothetical protein
LLLLCCSCCYAAVAASHCDMVGCFILKTMLLTPAFLISLLMLLKIAAFGVTSVFDGHF